MQDTSQPAVELDLHLRTKLPADSQIASVTCNGRGVDFRIVDEPLHSGQLSCRVRLLDINFIGRTWGLELEGRDEEEYVVEFHSGSPPRKSKTAV